MSEYPEKHSDRKAREAHSVLSEIIEAGGIVNLRCDRKGTRLAVRFDTIDSPSAVRLFIAYRTAQQSNPKALRDSALAMLELGLLEPHHPRQLVS